MTIYPISNKSHKIFILIILLLALFTRFYHLDYDSLWIDEGFSLRTATFPFHLMFDRAIQDTNPPLFTILLHFWVKLFGDGEFAARSLSALLNVFTLLLILPIGASLFNRRIAFYTVLIALLSPFQVFYAQEVRAYSLLNFLSLASVCFCIRIIQQTGHRANRSSEKNIPSTFSNKRQITFQAAYILFNVLLLHTHVYGWFIFLFENIWYFYLKLRSRSIITIRRWLILQGLILVCFLPYSLQFFSLVLSVQKQFWIDKPILLHFVGTFAKFSGAPILFGFFCIILAFLSYIIFKQRCQHFQYRNGLIFSVFWIGSVILVPFVLSYILRPFYQAHYAIGASIAFYFLVGLGIERLPKKGVRLAIIILTIVISSVYLHQYFNETTREPWREMVGNLKTDAGKEDLILLISDIQLDRTRQNLQLGITELHYDSTKQSRALKAVDYTVPDVFIYYAEGITQPILGVDETQVDNDSLNRSLLNQLKKYRKPIWFVASHFSGHEPLFLDQLKKTFKVDSTYSYFYRDLYNREILGIRVYRIIPKKNLKQF